MNVQEAYKKHDKDVPVKKMLNYIQDLASTVNVNIRDWEIEKLFFEGETVISSAKEINKRFFTHLTLVSKKVESDLDETTLKKIQDFETKVIQINRTKNEEIIRSYERDISSYNVHIASKLRSIKDVQAAALNPIKLDTALKGLKDTWFTLNDVVLNHTPQDCYLSFRTKTPLVLKDRLNPTIEVPLGYFIFNFAPIGCWTELIKANDTLTPNVDYGGYIHPFVSSSSDICWGNRGDDANKLIKETRITELLGLLESLLKTYPGEHPHVSLSSIFEKGKCYSYYTGNQILWTEFYKDPKKHGMPQSPSWESTKKLYCEHCDVKYNQDEEEHDDCAPVTDSDGEF